MEKIVLDASALLAMFLRETGADRIEALLVDSDRRALMSTLNWSEVFDRLLREGYTEKEVDRLLAKPDIEIVDFTRQQARITAGYRLEAPSLSLGDRACLSVASIENATAWTTDRQWSRAKLPVRVHLIR